MLYVITGVFCGDIFTSGDNKEPSSIARLVLFLATIAVLCFVLYKKRQTVATMMSDVVTIRKRIFARGTYSIETQRCIVEEESNEHGQQMIELY
jgi:hypothetical protein